MFGIFRSVLGALSVLGSALKSAFDWLGDKQLIDAGVAKAERDAALAALKAKEAIDEKRAEIDRLDDATVDDRLQHWFRRDAGVPKSD